MFKRFTLIFIAGFAVLIFFILKKQFFIIDLQFADENQYLSSAIHGFYFDSPVYKSCNSPLYIQWYKFLYWIVKNPTTTYLLNFTILPFLVSVGFGYILFKLKFDILTSLSFMLLFLLSDHLLNMWPMIGLFNCLLLLTSLIVLINYGLFKGFYFIFLILIASSYVRPENTVIIFLFLISITIGTYFENKLKLYLPKIALTITFIGLIYLLFGFPLVGGRSFYAFSQHYALNYTIANNLSLNPWINYKIIMNSKFSNSNSILDAFLYSPKIFMTHIFLNIKNIFIQSSNIIFGIIVPYKLIAFLGIKKFLTVFRLLIFVVCVGLLVKINKGFSFNLLKDSKSFFLLILIFTINGIFITILFYPRNHYLFSFVPFFILSIIMISRKIAKWRFTNANGLFFAFVFCLGIMSVINTKTNSRPFYDFARSVQSNNDSILIVDNFMEYEQRAGWEGFIKNCTGIPLEHTLKKRSFKDLISNKSIDLVILQSKESVNNKGYRKVDSLEISKFLSNPEKYNYSKIETQVGICYRNNQSSIVFQSSSIKQ